MSPDPRSDEPHAAVRRRLAGFAAVLAALIALAVAWGWSPMRDWLAIERIVGTLRDFGQASGPFAAIAGLAVASTIAVPLSVMTVVAIVTYGPLLGALYCLSGACLGGAASYALGRYLGREAVEKLAGRRINQISRRLAGHGLLSVIAIRLVPIAPFAIVNMLAGASHIAFRDFIFGTALGMIPGTVAVIVFIDQIIRAIREPGASTAVIATIVFGLIAGGLWALRKWADRDGPH